MVNSKHLNTGPVLYLNKNNERTGFRHYYSKPEPNFTWFSPFQTNLPVLYTFGRLNSSKRKKNNVTKIFRIGASITQAFRALAL
jgi:hypothetical protein